MKISTILGGVIACLVLSSASAKAASFDCNRQLPPGPAAMQQQRIGFLRVRGACGMNARCMQSAYDDQIQSLRAMFRQRGYPAPAMAMTRPY